MSPTPPTLNPSQTVERIREIIVGRHLEKLEGRVARLETVSANQNPTPVSQPPTLFEDRLLDTEAKVEALQEHVQRIDHTREEHEAFAAAQRDEVRLLAGRIEREAQEKAEAAARPAVEKLERKLGVWLGEWQKSLQIRLDERDSQLSSRMQSELSKFKDSTEKRFTDLDSRVPANFSDRIDRIAEAARALADSAASFSTTTRPL